MASIRVSTPERRDRLWLLNAFAVVLLTLLGAAGEALGYDPAILILAGSAALMGVRPIESG